MTNEKAQSRGKITLMICLAVIITLAGILTYLLLNGKEAEKPKRNVVVNEENAEKIASEMIEEEKTPLGYYEVTMNSTWSFEDGASASDNAYVKNSQGNTNSVYFDVVRSDTEETIYASPILPVGTHLESITLDEKLEAGTYDCVCTYYLLDEKDNPLSKVNVGLTIVIRN
ncbi:MAG: hypothetical protein LUH21_26790 [Clostridiales bacterium]|nr:hypothetical protein [Clostridiales bacterium]